MLRLGLVVVHPEGNSDEFLPGFLAVLCVFIGRFSYDSTGKMLIFAHKNGHFCAETLL